MLFPTHINYLKILQTSSCIFPEYIYCVFFSERCKIYKAIFFYYRHEIIEFPAVLVSTENRNIEAYFQAYCKPVLNPKLSKFCINLTGITQEQVDSAKPFPQVLQMFEDWLKEHELGTKYNFAFVTDGPWDMGRFLYGQCKVNILS